MELEEISQKFEWRWTVWFHEVENSDYSLKSYTKLYTIETIKDLCVFINTIENFTSGMFFLMKENILPMWETEDNKNGGMWTFKLTKKNANNIWNQLIAKCCGMTLTNDLEDMNMITGLSISPKISNCIIKIWNNDSSKKSTTLLNKELRSIEGFDVDSALYRVHKK